MDFSFTTFFNQATLLVIGAAILDIFANLLLAASQGFKRVMHGVGALLLVAAAFYCLSLAVQDMDLAVAYALWGCFGLIGTCLGGWILFRQKLRPVAFVGLGLLILGMILLRFG